jgi:transformation/transcription domain-associated protein
MDVDTKPVDPAASKQNRSMDDPVLKRYIQQEHSTMVAMGNAAEGTSPQRTKTEGGIGEQKAVVPAPVEDEFKPNQAMEEMIIEFLIRMVFLTADRKDKEMVVLHQHTQELMSEVLDVWPSAAVKFSHMQRLLEQAAVSPAAPSATPNGGSGGSQPSLLPADDVHPRLLTGLKVLDLVMTKQAELFVSTNVQQIKLVLAPVMRSKSQVLHALLCNVLVKFAKEFPPPSAGKEPVAEGKEVYDELDKLINACINAAYIAPAPTPLPQQNANQNNAQNAPPPALGSIGGATISCVLMVLTALMPSNPRYIDRHIPNIVKVMVRQASNNLAAAKMQAASGGRPPPKDPKASVDEYGSITYNVHQSVQLIGDERVLLLSDSRKTFPSALSHQLNDRNVDKAVLLSVMKALNVWVQGASPASGVVITTDPPHLSTKELKHFLSQLLQLRKAQIPAAVTPQFEASFLELVYELRKVDFQWVLPASPAGAQQGSAAAEAAAAQAQAQTNLAVELKNPLFIQGLRASTAELRQRFFQVYNEVSTLKP